MFEITIDGVTYPLKFGMGFLREINKRTSVPVDGMPGVNKNVGLRYVIAQVIDGGVEALEETIMTANKTENPRLTIQALDAWIENEDTDIDRVFEDVLSFFETANATKTEYQYLQDAIAAANQQ